MTLKENLLTQSKQIAQVANTLRGLAACLDRGLSANEAFPVLQALATELSGLAHIVSHSADQLTLSPPERKKA